MKKPKIEEVIAKVLSIDPKIVNDQTGPDNVPSWDSFNGLALITALEKQFGLKADIEEMAAIKNVGDIKDLLRKYHKL